VNFVELKDNCINVRTYERGVEAETYACGTGVTASSIATYLYSPHKGFAEKQQVAVCPNGEKCEEVELVKYDIHALGDDLQVNFKYNKSSKAFTDVYLTGPATFVFECDIEIA